jgi:peptidoglycan L-alanyl-D-glutamate endopeptidase CwlK
MISENSINKLATCDERLQRVMNAAIKKIDFKIICGYRNEAEQNKAFCEGKSKLKFPYSKHNKNPARAVDIAPYPLLFDAKQKDFIELARVILDTAKALNIAIRWGGDWDGDGYWNDETFFDGAHFEV